MTTSSPFQIPQLLELMLQRGASDLHLKTGSPPGFRVDGRIMVDQELPPLRPEDTSRLAHELVAGKSHIDLTEPHDVDFGFEMAGGVSRHRVSISRQRGSFSIVLRRVPVEIPDLDRIGLPAIAKRLATLQRGLVLVTGPTGSGKSTTLAAMINYLNRTTNGHIVTMEDPIEFVHSDHGCFITQREIGVDCESFHQALRRALRQDPDIIMIGELRDLETISLAITAAETGHLVFGTLHTTGAAQTVDRIVDAFPPGGRDQVRIQLSYTLQGVLSQTLVRKASGGRVAAFEVMIASEAIRSCIREGKTHQMANHVQTGSQLGMQTLDMALANLVRAGTITQQEGRAKASSTKEFEKALTHGGMPLRALPRAPLRRTTKDPIPGPVQPSPDVATAPPKVTDSVLDRLRNS